MSAQVAVTIVDEVPGRGRHVAFKLELWSEKITARELIERRIRHEVEVYNENPPDPSSASSNRPTRSVR